MLPTLPRISELLSVIGGEISETGMEPNMLTTLGVSSPYSAPLDVIPTFSDHIIPKLYHMPTDLTVHRNPRNSVFPTFSGDYIIPKLTHMATDQTVYEVPRSSDGDCSSDVNAKPKAQPKAQPEALPESPTLPEQVIPQPKTPLETNDIPHDDTSGDQVEFCAHDGLSAVKVELGNQQVWEKFHNVENEMMVTKSGRLMFPVLRFKITGLIPNDNYKIAVAFTFVDEYRYRFSPVKNAWKRLFTDKLEPTEKHRRLYEHPSSPARGEEWSSWPVSFAKLKITSSLEQAKLDDRIYIPTMRKYRVQLVVTKLHCSRCPDSHTRHIDLPLTEFVAVTAYNNNKVTQLKIENNPYAKYLRDEDYKNPESIPNKSENNWGKATSTQATSTQAISTQSTDSRTDRKRKRENVAKSPWLVSNPGPDTEVESYWSKRIEASSTNSLQSTSYIDLTSSTLSIHQRERRVVPYYEGYGGTLEYSYSLHTKPEIYREVPETRNQDDDAIACNYGYNHEPCYTLNYDSYNRCNYDNYPSVFVDSSGMKQYAILN